MNEHSAGYLRHFLYLMYYITRVKLLMREYVGEFEGLFAVRFLARELIQVIPDILGILTFPD